MFKEKIARLYFLFSYSRQETGSGQFHFLIVKRVGVMCGSNIQAGGKNINDMTGFPTDTAFFCLAFASSVCKDERGTGSSLEYPLFVTAIGVLLKSAISCLMNPLHW